MTNSDWVGNKPSVYVTNGASNHSVQDRQSSDYYATPSEAVECLLQKEIFNHYIWECACGEGHISKVLEKHGYDVKSTDLIDRHYGTGNVDFLKVIRSDMKHEIPRDIITNPPYKYAQEFVEKAMELSMDGIKIAMLLKLTFLEGKKRKLMFQKYPPKKVLVFSSRINCAKNGMFEAANTSVVAYGWYIWEKGFTGKPVIEWIN